MTLQWTRSPEEDWKLTELLCRAALIRLWLPRFLRTPIGAKKFIGHAHLTADYTNCSGLGWVTDFIGVNQAYTATVLDADTGSDPE